MRDAKKACETPRIGRERFYAEQLLYKKNARFSLRASLRGELVWMFNRHAVFGRRRRRRIEWIGRRYGCCDERVGQWRGPGFRFFIGGGRWSSERRRFASFWCMGRESRGERVDAPKRFAGAQEEGRGRLYGCLCGNVF